MKACTNQKLVQTYLEFNSFSFLLLTLINLNLDNACSANPRDGEWALEL